MGLFDLPAPLLGFVDHALGRILPDVIRLVLWGALAGWLTMLIYRALSNQERIRQLKTEQQAQQKVIAGFDGEFEELFPLIRHALALGMRQLGLSLGPALLATLPILFIIVWVAGEFGYRQPEPGTLVKLEVIPAYAIGGTLHWDGNAMAERTPSGWTVRWPPPEKSITLLQAGESLFELPLKSSIPVLHKRRWWNWLMANPAGYLPDDAIIASVNIQLVQRQFLAYGPKWCRSWLFSFFASFLLSSVGFKLALKIE